MRNALEGLIALSLRIFFRRIHIVGAEHIPAHGPVIFALNHPNGLVDPLLALCFLPRRICFLAKATLFSHPLIGWAVRMLESIPIYRSQDRIETDDSPDRAAGHARKNNETFEAARRALNRGLAIAIFPEGISHNHSAIQPLKSGLARIALGSDIEGLRIVPGGIAYSAKTSFRSSALIYLGPSFQVEAADRKPTDRAAIRELTATVRTHLESAHMAMSSYEIETPPGKIRSAPWRIRVLFPFALIGLILHYPTFRLIRAIAFRLSKGEEDLVATFKLIGGIFLFPITWILLAGIVGWTTGWLWAQLAALMLPFAAWTALLFGESLDRPVRSVKQ